MRSRPTVPMVTKGFIVADAPSDEKIAAYVRLLRRDGEDVYLAGEAASFASAHPLWGCALEHVTAARTHLVRSTDHATDSTDHQHSRVAKTPEGRRQRVEGKSEDVS